MTAVHPTTEIPLEGGVINGIRIGLDPHRPGLDLIRLIDESVPLWAIIANLEGTRGDVAQTAAEFSISVDAVRAAKSYYEAHPEYIDAFLLINRSCFR